MNVDDACIAVIGLGYVGLPLAVEFGKRYPTVGFDINRERIKNLREGEDDTLEVSSEELAGATYLHYSFSVDELYKANVYIVTVPTPIDRHKQPNLEPLRSASEMLGGVISKGDVIVYESTVYPGATEEQCIPVVELVSGLKYNRDFFAGYSPERINPGDKERRISNIIKVTSGSNREIANYVDALYTSIITAGTYKAKSIKVAEAAKVIENTQRDVNIALINELAIIFEKMDIDTEDVLKAAGTKWNFLPFRPGLVGGHCIGVDPYYLTHKAASIGYDPEMILAGRKINDGMGEYVASQLVKEMIKRKIKLGRAKILVLGLAFKENCPDIRNTKVVDVIENLQEYDLTVDVYDPWVSAEVALKEYGLKVLYEPESHAYDGIVLAVAHREFIDMGEQELREFGASSHILYDLKYCLPSDQSDIRL